MASGPVRTIVDQKRNGWERNGSNARLHEAMCSSSWDISGLPCLYQGKVSPVRYNFFYRLLRISTRLRTAWICSFEFPVDSVRKQICRQQFDQSKRSQVNATSRLSNQIVLRAAQRKKYRGHVCLEQKTRSYLQRERARVCVRP